MFFNIPCSWDVLQAVHRAIRKTTVFQFKISFGTQVLQESKIHREAFWNDECLQESQRTSACLSSFPLSSQRGVGWC